MTKFEIKYQLARHKLHIWQLCKALGISRSTYYLYSHDGFKGHEKDIKNAIRNLVKGSVKDAD